MRSLCDAASHNYKDEKSNTLTTIDDQSAPLREGFGILRLFAAGGGNRMSLLLRSSAVVHTDRTDRTDCRRELKGYRMTAGHVQVTEARGPRPNLATAGMLP
jgi:hypothetical protein